MPVLEKARAPYPYMSVNGDFYSKEFLDAAWNELLAKAPIWAAGIETPTKCEKFTYDVLKQITMRRPDQTFEEID